MGAFTNHPMCMRRILRILLSNAMVAGAVKKIYNEVSEASKSKVI
jgi:hypothetical protein